MLLLMILLTLMRATESKPNAGTAIFNNHIKGDCWNNDDIVKLRARRAFEKLIPPRVNPNQIDAHYICHALHYFKRAIHSMDKEAKPHTLPLLKEAVSDTIGAHLRSEILPAVRFAYYAGYIPYRNAREIHDFYDTIKVYLNTQGNGWKKPKRTQSWSNLTVAKILIGTGTFFDPCSSLLIKRDSNHCIHLPVPKQDNDQKPSAIVLPFKRNGLVSLNSPESANVLLKYYTTASRCILSSSPEKCRHTDFVSFNNELWHWMKRDVAPHLADEKLFTAYGGVLRIAASVQNYGKGLSRRNLFENEDGESKWHPWRSLTQSYVYVNADWTPQVYIGLVIMTALTIYLLLMCYGYLLGNQGGCICGNPVGYFKRENSNTERNTTVMPFQSAIYYSDKLRNKKYSKYKSKTASSSSIKQEKVYDLNENTEKLMEVIMSSSEGSESSASSRSSEGEGNVETIRAKSASPPRLETSMSELTVDRRTACTSSRTDTLKCGSLKASESQSTGSDSSSSSSRSATSTSKSKSGSSRDLAWARRVISRHSSKSKISSRREDRTSCTLTDSRSIL